MDRGKAIAIQGDSVKGREGQPERLLWRYLLIWPESDRPEYQSSWRGLLAQRLQGSTPAEIVGEIFSGDAMEATHPFL